MSAKSRKSAKGIKRPIPAAVLAEARRIAGEYQIVLAVEEGHYYGRGLELPNVFGDGSTVEACMKDTRLALETTVATLLEQGDRPPAPASSGRRTEQVNVRLSAEEKLLLESAAKHKGFSGLSDFIRYVAVEAAR